MQFHLIIVSSLRKQTIFAVLTIFAVISYIGLSKFNLHKFRILFLLIFFVTENKRLWYNTHMRKYSKAEYLSVLKPYFIVVSSVLLIMLIFFNIVLISFRNEINNNFTSTTTFFSKSIDEKLNVIEDYANAMIFSNSVAMMNKYGASYYANYAILNHAYDIVYDIRRFIASNALIDDIYIYYPDSDLIIGKHGFYNSRTYYALTVSDKYAFLSKNHYSDWMNSLFNTDRLRFFTVDINKENSPEAFFRTKTADYNSSKRIIVVKLDKSYIKNMMTQLFSSSDYKFIGLIDANNAIYASAGDDTVFYDSITSNHNSRQYINNVSESEIFGLRFFTFQKYSSVYKTFNIATIITAIGFIISILVSTFLSLRYSSRHVDTINKISGRLADNETHEDSGSLSYIEKRIDEILDEKDTAIGESNRRKKTIENMFFKEFLTEDKFSNQDINRKCSRFGIYFKHPIFSLIIIPTCGKPDRYYEELLRNYSDSDIYIVMTNNLDGRDIYLCNYSNSGKAVFTSLVQKIKRNYNDTGECRILRGGASLCDIHNMWKEFLENSNNEKQSESGENRHNTTSITETIHSIIENEYSNPQLGLGTLAERFNVSQPYLSKQFKQHYSIGINNYINTLRINDAKQRLIGTNDTISEIAVKVGYLNDVNFIRVFKKYENVTPGSFRLTNGMDNTDNVN